MRISEIYASVQGETQYAGLPCAFVRTTGCDLRCGYCDTAYAFYGGHEKSVGEVVEAVAALGTPLVLLTGGEPLLQKEIGLLARRLLDLGLKVMIETSGAHALDALPPEVIRIVDIKTPGSGEADRMRWDVLDGLRPRDAAKFVVCSESDYEWARDIISTKGLADRTEVLLSPSHGVVDPKELVSWMLRDRVRARLNLQVHKYVWGPEVKGV